MKLKRFITAAFLSLMAITALPATGSAQDAQESTVKYRKKDCPGVIAGYKSGDDVVRAALLKRLAAAGLTNKKTQKGFYVFSGVNWNEVMPEKVDVYVRVEGNSSKATAYIMIAKGYDNFISAATDPGAIDKLKNVLNTLPADIADYEKAQAVAAQQAAVEKAAEEAKKAEKEAERAARRQAKKQEKLEKQQRKLSEMGGR